MNRKKVLLGMSGGTDSSVAAMLLQEQGYDVTGITFRFYEIDENTAYLSEAAELAARLGIPHYIYDARAEFEMNICPVALLYPALFAIIPLNGR